MITIIHHDLLLMIIVTRHMTVISSLFIFMVILIIKIMKKALKNLFDEKVRPPSKKEPPFSPQSSMVAVGYQCH